MNKVFLCIQKVWTKVLNYTKNVLENILPAIQILLIKSQGVCSKRLGAKQDFCSNDLGVKQDFFQKFWVWSKALIKHFGCKARLLVKTFRVKKEFCSSLLGANNTFFQMFYIQSKTFVQRLECKARLLFNKNVDGREDVC